MSSPLNEFRADLHCHSICSDGSLTPEELILLAHSQGLQGISITDHDSVDAYPAALDSAKEVGMKIIPGVEFSTVHKGTSIHVLAYSFSVFSQDIHDFCSEHHKRRENRVKEMLALLNKAGMPLTEDEIYAFRGSKRGVGRPHLAQAMVKKGYVKDTNEAFKRFLGESKPCYASGKPNTVEETLAVIHKAKGYAVLAHPHLIDNTAALKSLLDMPFDGMECHYARFSEAQNKRWISIAERKNWLILGGSDFHGSIKPTIPLGCSWVPESTFRFLQARFLENQHQ